MARPDPAWSPSPRDGVNASRVAVAAAAGAARSAIDFLIGRFPAIDDWASRMSRGDVLDAQGRPMTPGTMCRSGDLIWYWRDPPPEQRVPFEIELLHRDDHLVVVDKPHFLAVTPGGRHLHETVLVRLARQLGISTLTPMHRLDRDTAGVLAFIVRPETRNAYQALLRDRAVHKVYEAIAPLRADVVLPLIRRDRLEQRPGKGFMQMQVVDGEPNAETLIERLGAGSSKDSQLIEWARYRLTPSTGKTHQLRVHMNALGLPIAGDRIYPELLPEPTPDSPPDYSQPLQLLARELSFVDPIDGRHRRFVSRRELLMPWSGPPTP